ncbi:MAG: NosD domain-containing protein [Candidatus Hodarchaeota archaeon]
MRNKKALILVGFVILSVFLIIPQVRAEDGLIEVSPFIISGNSDWESLSMSQSWCSGNGTINNPYIIENIEVAHTDYDYFDRGVDNCLKIENSDVYFTIRNCMLHGAGRLPIKQDDGSWIIGYGGSGIFLYNCSNGLIINNTCYDNVQSNGIVLADVKNTVVMNNSCFDNVVGIYIGAYSENNIVQENNVGTNKNGGIYTYMVYNNKIINNNIIGDYRASHNIGINMRESDNNLIDGNLIDHALTGIELEASDYNNITNNIVYYYEYDIVDYISNIGNIFENNTCIFDDFMPPSISISEPQNDQIFNRTSPSFNVYIVERLSTGLNSQWYTLNNGTIKYNFSLVNIRIGNDSYGEYIAGDGIGEINQEAWDKLANVNITIRFYAKDNKGNIAYKEVIVVKEAPPEPPIIEYVIGFIILGITILFGFIGRIYYRKRG